MSNYLNFLKTLNLPVQLSSVVSENQHPDLHLVGWRGIISLTGFDHNNETYELDIRYGWGQEIFKQHLFDHGWNLENLSNSITENQAVRHKIIIYLCESSVKIEQTKIIRKVPDKFIIGSYWQTIHHCYLQLPLEHPFKLPQPEQNYLSFATTRNISDKQPKYQQLGQLIAHPQRQGEGGLRTKGCYKQSLPNLPLISVITVVFNGEKYLEQTIQSIINSAYPNLEYIIIDGASQDNSVAIIKHYEDYIDYWVSEPDNGIYDGMNQGAIAASGDYTLHINADDLLFNAQCLENVVKEIQTQYQEKLANVFSTILFYRLDKETLSLKPPKTPHPDPFLNIVKIPGSHQGFLGIRNKSSLFNNQQYQIVAERVMMSEKMKKEPVTISDTVVAICRSGGVSYGINFAMLNEMTRATAKSRNPQIFFTLLTEYLRLSLLSFVKITGLIKLKSKI